LLVQQVGKVVPCLRERGISARRGTQPRFGFNLAAGSPKHVPKIEWRRRPIAEIDTAFAPLASDRPEDLGSAVHGMPAVQLSAVETAL